MEDGCTDGAICQGSRRRDVVVGAASERCEAHRNETEREEADHAVHQPHVEEMEFGAVGGMPRPRSHTTHSR